MSGKFECNQQGCCCRDLRGKLGKASFDRFDLANKNGPAYFLLNPKDLTIPLFEWEVKKLRELGNEKSVEFKTKPNSIVFDEQKRIGLVLSWNLDHDSCPFLSENKCIIYENRPSICKKYPVKSPHEIEGYLVDFSYGCSAIEPFKNEKPIPRIEAERMVRNYFGDAYYYAVQNSLLLSYTSWLIKLAAEKELIKPIKSKPLSFFIKKIDYSKLYGSEEFLLMNGINLDSFLKTKEEILDFEKTKTIEDMILNGTFKNI